MDLVYGKIRISLPSGWNPTFHEFKETYILHGIVIDFETEFKKLYGKCNSVSSGSSQKNESVQPTKKGSRNSKI